MSVAKKVKPDENYALTMPHKAAFIKNLIPSILSMLTVCAYSFVDTFTVGRELREPGVAAIGFGTVLVSALWALGFLFGIGGGVVFSMYKGRGESASARKVFSLSFYAATAVGVAAAVLGNLYVTPIARALGATDGNIELSMQYLSCVFTFAPFFLLDLTMTSFMRNEGKPNVAMAATMIGTGLNIVLDIIFVWYCGMELYGAALATCICEIVCVCITLCYSYRHRLLLRLCRVKLILGELGRVVKNGLGSFAMEASVGVITAVFIKAAEGFYGDAGAAAFTIVMTLHLVFYSLMCGVTEAVQPLISLSRGAGMEDRVRAFTKDAFITVGIFEAAIVAVCLLFTRPLVEVFVSEGGASVEVAVEGFRLYLAGFVFMGIGMTAGVYFQSIEAPGQAFAVLLGRSMVFPVAALAVLSAAIGPNAVWLSVPAGELMAMALGIILMATDRRKTQRHCEAGR